VDNFHETCVIHRSLSLLDAAVGKSSNVPQRGTSNRQTGAERMIEIIVMVSSIPPGAAPDIGPHSSETPAGRAHQEG
jgi:hypothetical protein